MFLRQPLRRAVPYGARNAVNETVRYQVTAPAAEEVTDSIKPFSSIPGHTPLPFIGTSWVFYPLVGKYTRQKSHIYDREKYYRFGDIARDVFSGGTIVSCYNEKDFETVLRNESKTPARGFLKSLAEYRKHRSKWYETLGVLLTDGQEWYDLRFKLQKHLMKPRTVDRYVEPITNVAHDLCDRIVHYRDSNNELDNTENELFKWSLESVAYVGLDKRLGCLDVNSSSDALNMINSTQTAFDCMNNMEAFTGNSLQLWKWFPTPVWRKFVKAKDVFSEIAFREVKAAMERMKAKTALGEVDTQPTVLQAMLASPELKPGEIITMVMDMLMGGIDTTSNATSFLLHQLATNPDKQEKLYQDILRALPSSTDKLTAEILADMRYLKLCLKESSRLTPVARGIGRVIDRDLVLSGYHIPKGTQCLLMLQTVGRFEKFFSDPNRFIPERWADRDSKPSPYLLVPFGFGTRSCIGRRIAELEIQTLIVTLLRKFKIEYHYGDIDMCNRMANVPDRPLKFAFIDRH